MTVGVAVIGCGSTAHRRHLPVWRSLTGARLVAVASRDPERRRSAAERFGASRSTDDWRTLLADPEVHAVDVCVPHAQHAEICVAMARAGKHVLCEKPLATTLVDCQAMVEAARQNGVVLMPFHNLRLGGVAARAVEVVQGGDIGRPLLVRGVMAHGGPDAMDPTRSWFLEASAGGGAVLDLGPHLLDLITALVGQRAVAVRSTLRYGATPGVERDGLIEVSYPGGLLAHVALSWSFMAGRETSLVVQGDEGVLRLCLLQSPDPSADAPAAPLTLARRRGAGIAVEYLTPLPNREPCELFLQAIGGAVVPLTAEDGLETIRHIDAAYRSHATGGQWIQLRPS